MTQGNSFISYQRPLSGRHGEARLCHVTHTGQTIPFTVDSVYNGPHQDREGNLNLLAQGERRPSFLKEELLSVCLSWV